ncbi:MAG: Asp-tRNA(Asn)/Glu-tRNA(Gln) amidotransferase subunit GatA [Bacteroidetes bacterium]|nr:MAG: Asp-tRNA(Asn)/Glu-tRNA(Gln) amidotransferase subunit GatA [Bacteroidota bacterium]
MKNCVTTLQQSLERIEATKDTRAYLEVYAEEALARAEAIDQKIAQGTAGKLAGLVVGLKDLFCYKQHAVSASSRILQGFQAQYNATAVERLLAEDAIIIGRHNCDEFGMGSSGENSAFGAVRNGLNADYVAGGSSGGSAVAVQTHTCHVALGSDTGGSVRQPASFCGIMGLKPTYGRISRHGLIAYASSFDVVGIFAHTAPEIAQVLEVIAGADEWDSTASILPVPAYSENLSLNRKLKIAYLPETLSEQALCPFSQAQMQARFASLEREGHSLEAVSFPYLEYVLPTYYLLTTAEASSNLARYDGVRYGYRAQDVQSLEDLYKKTRSEGFGREVQRRLMLGTFVLQAGFYDAYYQKAQQVRRLIQQWTLQTLEKYDFIILPTTPSTAFRLGEKRENATQMFWEDVFTVQANLAGVPALTLPNGTHPNGLPIGLQVLAKPFAEGDLLAFAHSL